MPGDAIGVVRPWPNPGATIRLLCVPHAGGGASVFNGWPRDLGPRVELCAIQLPGRESRITQPPFRDLATLTPVLGRTVAPLTDRPFAMFGHSMGALVSFELARWLRARGLPGPVHIFASSRPAPHLPLARPGAHLLSDDRLVDRVHQMGGTPAELLADSRFRRLLLPLLRADIAVNDGYVYRPEPPLDCPITACGGRDDMDVDERSLAAWGEHTTGEFRLSKFDGGHFYLQDSRTALLRLLRDVLVRLDVSGMSAAG
ncbi:MAG TPA: alpha/beta fold hydrolase [Micromonosporaceae bacterium]|nr:alpha/beta fold hydrolase [Micromonosporaceae bacterium]